MIAAIGLGSCTIVPEIPDDYSMPVQQIVLAATCELQRAFISLDQQKSPFGAKKWLVGLTLSPKTDREVIAGVGNTGKSTGDATKKYFNSWAVVTPGLQGDVKGTSSASVSFKIHSRDLIAHPELQAKCPTANPTFNALAAHLGVGEWLARTIAAQVNGVGKLVTYDKPTFSTEIFIKYSGNGTFTYNFPLGTDLASLAGSYDLDETLSIALTPDAQKSVLVVQTLPSGGQFGSRPPDQVVVQSHVNSETRLDAIQSQQQIIDKLNNLRN